MKIFLFLALALTFTSTVWCSHNPDQTSIASTSTSNVKQESRAALKPHQSIVYSFDIVDGKIVHLSSIGRKIENHVQTSPSVHKYMQPAHRWSQLRDRASTLKQDVAIIHAEISKLDQRIKSSNPNGFQKIFKTDTREKLQQLKDEHARGILTKGFANDNLRMLHSDLKILRKNQMLPGHVTDWMINAHIES